MNTCGNCYYFEAVKGQSRKVGHCLCEPPLAFPGMAPTPLSFAASPSMQPVVQSYERPVSPDRRECRHWKQIVELAVSAARAAPLPDWQKQDGGAA